MKLLKLVCLLAAAAVMPSACHHHTKSDALASNFAELRVGDAALLDAATGQPYEGTLIARGEEITRVALLVLRGTPLLAKLQASGNDISALILILPVIDGQPSGSAELHVDLRVTTMTGQLSRWREAFALAVARKLSPTVKVAEASFVNGKLEGTATLFAPNKDATATTKVAEAQFRDSRLHGPLREYLTGTDKLRRELSFTDGVRSGRQRVFYPSGALERESSYLNGKLDGTMSEYYADGSKRRRLRFKAGHAVGVERSWFPTGQRETEVVYDQAEPRITHWYSNGALKLRIGPQGETKVPPEGLVVDYHNNGAVHARTHYVAGEKHGAFETFYPDESRWQQANFADGKLQGSQKKWWKNRQLALDATWVAGKLEGSYQRWYASGKLWEQASYQAGKRIGHYQKWWKNGARAHDYHYQNGKLVGDYRTYYDSGGKWAVGSYAAGKPQATLKRWFPDGKLGYLKEHKNGRADGAYKRWYADGSRRLEARYLNGHLDGEFKNWLEDGSAYELASYERGKKLTTTLAKPTATPHL